MENQETQGQSPKTTTLKLKVMLPITAGAVACLAGGDIETAALVGAGAAAIQPIAATIEGITTSNKLQNKQVSQKVAATAIAGTVLFSALGAGIGAGSHKLTDKVIDNLAKRNVIEQTFTPKQVQQSDSTYQFGK